MLELASLAMVLTPHNSQHLAGQTLPTPKPPLNQTKWLERRAHELARQTVQAHTQIIVVQTNQRASQDKVEADRFLDIGPVSPQATSLLQYRHRKTLASLFFSNSPLTRSTAWFQASSSRKHSLAKRFLSAQPSRQWRAHQIWRAPKLSWATFKCTKRPSQLTWKTVRALHSSRQLPMKVLESTLTEPVRPQLTRASSPNWRKSTLAIKATPHGLWPKAPLYNSSKPMPRW